VNIYAVIILVTILIGFILDLVADLLNLKNLENKLPSEFEDVFDNETYIKSQEYSTVKTKFGFFTSVFSLLVMLGFWFLGGFNWLNNIVSFYLEDGILRGLGYIGILLLANFVLTLPFSIYSTFVIEEKFGFNKTTAGTFVMDILKSLLLTIIIGGGLLAAVLYIFGITGEYAWLYGWMAVVFISIILQYIAPTFIMPMFNKFKPLEDGTLRNSILDYAKSVDYPLTNVFVMDGSKRSTKSNAFFTGFWKNKRVALYDTLIEKHTEEEIVAILAHEIGHYKKNHILKNMLISIIHTGILFFLLSIFLYQKGMYDAFYMDAQPIYAGLIFFAMLYTPMELILSVFLNIMSRKNEYEADKFAVKTTGYFQEMINALKKLSKDNLSNLTPHPFYVFS